MKKLTLILYFSISLGFAGLTYGADKIDDSDVFATVNGTPLGMSLYEFLLGSREQENQERLAHDDGFNADMHQQQVAKDLIMTEILAQQAMERGIHDTELVRIEMEMAKKTLLAQLYVQELMASIEVDESQIRDYYEQQKEQIMYRFMIWQTPDEARANRILSALKAAGGDNTNDPDAIETPWLQEADIAPEVNEIVRHLDPGDFAAEPIFQDGVWKIVQVIDKNVMKRESYEEERELMKSELVRMKLDEKLDELAAGASVEFQ